MGMRLRISAGNGKLIEFLHVRIVTAPYVPRRVQLRLPQRLGASDVDEPAYAQTPDYKLQYARQN